MCDLNSFTDFFEMKIEKDQIRSLEISTSLNYERYCQMSLSSLHLVLNLTSNDLSIPRTLKSVHQNLKLVRETFTAKTPKNQNKGSLVSRFKIYSSERPIESINPKMTTTSPQELPKSQNKSYKRLLDAFQFSPYTHWGYDGHLFLFTSDVESEEAVSLKKSFPADTTAEDLIRHVQ